MCKLSDKIITTALNLGFSACGIAEAKSVDKEHCHYFNTWLNNGFNRNMEYMANYLDKRLNPALLMPGTKSIISVALNYYPQQEIDDKEYQIATYAYGKDYHVILKDKLHKLAAALNFQQYSANEVNENVVNYKAFCDTAPILERYWAQKAGLGWIGKNRNFIINKQGNYFLLGELLIDIALDYSQPTKNRCGKCTACLDACPTKALTNGFDCELCLSYQTIENRESIPQKLHSLMNNSIYGCDVCIKVCPHNRYSTPTKETDFQISTLLINMKKSDWNNLSVEQYQQLFKDSAVKRTKFSGLTRNISIVKGNL